MRRALPLLLLAACAPDPTAGKLTWHRDVAPIVERKCGTCGK